MEMKTYHSSRGPRVMDGHVESCSWITGSGYWLHAKVSNRRYENVQVSQWRKINPICYHTMPFNYGTQFQNAIWYKLVIKSMKQSHIERQAEESIGILEYSRLNFQTKMTIIQKHTFENPYLFSDELNLFIYPLFL